MPTLTQVASKVDIKDKYVGETKHQRRHGDIIYTDYS